LAAALVHKPPLLVLDEPTVGIDPVLRENIWKHLIDLTKEGITVIITTHYIEEARSANTVAFIRQGTLLQEGNPDQLMKQFDLNNLNDVFLKLCETKSINFMNRNNNCINTVERYRNIINNTHLNESQTTKENISPLTELHNTSFTSVCVQNNAVHHNSLQQRNSIDSKNSTNSLNSYESVKRNRLTDHFARISALFLKNVTRLFRNLPVLIFTLLVPSIQGIKYSYIK